MAVLGFLFVTCAYCFLVFCQDTEYLCHVLKKLSEFCTFDVPAVRYIVNTMFSPINARMLAYCWIFLSVPFLIICCVMVCFVAEMCSIPLR